MATHRPLDPESRGRHLLLRVIAPPIAICLAAMASSPVVARGALPSSERAALSLALALSLSHLAAQRVPAGTQLAPPPRGGSAPIAVKDLPTVAEKDVQPAAPKLGVAESIPVAQAQSGDRVSPTGDSGAGSGATHQGGPNGPDDRNLGNGGPTGGTTPAPSGASGATQNSIEGSGGPAGASGVYGSGDKNGGGEGGASNSDSGSGSESNGGNQRSPAPQQ